MPVTWGVQDPERIQKASGAGCMSTLLVLTHPDVRPVPCRAPAGTRARLKWFPRPALSPVCLCHLRPAGESVTGVLLCCAEHTCKMQLVAAAWSLQCLPCLRLQERDRILTAFCAGRMRVVVATVAFGMGVDAQGVRGVVHMSLPRSLEEYVQQVTACRWLLSHDDADAVQPGGDSAAGESGRADGIGMAVAPRLLACVVHVHVSTRPAFGENSQSVMSAAREGQCQGCNAACPAVA